MTNNTEGACALNDLGASKSNGGSRDLLYEFDPLVKKNLTLCNSDKNNQLLLLEYLIKEDIYGSNSNLREGLDDHSQCSDETEHSGEIEGSSQGKPVSIM